MITSVIFDLDDVIVDSSLQHFEAFSKALKEFGAVCPKIPRDLSKSIYGLRIREIVGVFIKHFKLNVDVDGVTKRRNEIFMETVKKGVVPMEGLFDLVANIKKWGLRRGVASSGVREYVEEVLRQLKLADFFEVVVTGDDVVNSKPSPEIFLLAAEKLDVRPAECCVIEDADNGVTAGKKAGMMVIGLKSDSGQTLHDADVVVDRLDEITLEMLGLVR